MPQRTAKDLSAPERRRLLRGHLAEHGEIGLAEACRLLGASTATLRRDFEQLVTAGHATRQWGVLKPAATGLPGGMTPFADREGLEAKAKAAIAREAATLVADGDVVFVDGGTTTLRLATHLAGRRIKIITNSIAIAHVIDRERRGRLGAEVFLTGGQLWPDSFLLVGPQARATLDNYKARLAFLSAAGLDRNGASNNNELVVEVEQKMMAQSAQTILLVDASKFGRRAMAPICELRKLHTLITNREPPRELSAALDAGKVRLINAGESG
jgi:DeoR/GlpR family transcriptional regulator of sugar metabolism